MRAASHNEAVQVAWAREPGRNDGLVRVFALINHAVATGLLEALQRWKPVRWRSLFDGTPESRALEAAPILVELGDLAAAPPIASVLLLSWLHERISTSNGLILLQSQWTFDALGSALHARLDARLEPDVPVMLRYFDTRILATLPDVLTPSQFRSFMSIAQRWSWLDRFGKWTEHSVDESEIDTWNLPLRLTQAQENFSVELAEPDSIVRLMKEIAPDLCAGKPEGTLYLLAKDKSSIARNFGVESVREIALFCMVELQDGPDFHKHDRWQHLMQSIRKEGDFIKILSKFDHE